jgi:hypothetical protein
MNGVGLEKGALNGVRVVDFGQYLSAPMVAMFFADNGADVIHIDPPEGPRWDHPANAAPDLVRDAGICVRRPPRRPSGLGRCRMFGGWPVSYAKL